MCCSRKPTEHELYPKENTEFYQGNQIWLKQMQIAGIMKSLFMWKKYFYYIQRHQFSNIKNMFISQYTNNKFYWIKQILLNSKYVFLHGKSMKINLMCTYIFEDL